MNGFQKHKITPLKGPLKARLRPLLKWMKAHIILSIILIFVGMFMMKGVFGAIESKDLSFKGVIVGIISEPVQKDAFGHTNMLLIGVGGEGHDGANLTDTMIVASIDNKEHTVSMLSIPRDIWVENEVVGWGTRINGVYESIEDGDGHEELAMQELQSEIENIVGLDIHYYAKVDFKGFQDIVDALGGLEVEVHDTIYDVNYPADTGYGFQTFYLEEGLQELDGESALKYARSRYSTSDFDRAARQQQLIGAMKDKALSLGILLNPNRLKSLYTAVSSNFETNLSWDEMVYLAGQSDKFSTDEIQSAVLHDAPFLMGGFLFTPDRTLYGGAFVLTPYAGDWSEVHRFAKLFFYYPEIYKEEIPIQVLNGTSTPGLAGLTKMHLTRLGLNVYEYGNGAEKGIVTSLIIPTSDPETLQTKTSETLQILPSLGFGDIVSETPLNYTLENWDTSSDIILELGEDYLNYYLQHEEWFYEGFY
jgi:LCP family protein required for cell wall assembly